MADAPLLPLALRLARRELRHGLAGFRIFLACLAVGVAAIAAVGSISAAMLAGLDADARDILGGDVEFRLPQRALPADETAWLSARGRMSEIRQLRAMLRRTDGDARTLVELKAVDGAYPLSGSVSIAPAMKLAQALEIRGGTAGVLVDPAVLDRLHAKPGDLIALGDAKVEIRGVLVKQPDAATNLFSFGPPVLIAMAGLAATGLDQPGTLSTAAYRLILPPGTDPAAFIAQAKAAFPDAGWQTRDLAHAAPGIQGFVDRLGLFLTLAGLTALLVGGVGVGNAAASYLDRKTAVIATLKCLGAPARLVYATYLAQILVLASGGIAIGLAVGAAAPWLVQYLGGDLLPVALRLRLYPLPLLLATAFGLMTALGFSLWPLARARGVSPGSLFRSAAVPARTRLRLADWVATALVAASLAALALASASDKRLAGWFLLAVGLALGAYRAAGLLIMAAARRIGRPRRPWLRLAVTNLYRPGAPTASVVLSLGMGLTVLVAVALVEGSLSRELGGRIAEGAPSFFFIDIQPDQAAAFDALVKASPARPISKACRACARGSRGSAACRPIRRRSTRTSARWCSRSAASAIRPPCRAARAWWPATGGPRTTAARRWSRSTRAWRGGCT